MRTLASAAAVGMLTLVTACGGGSDTQAAPSDPPGTTTTGPTAPEASPNPDGTASPEVTASAGGGGGGQTLIGTVGEDGDPEAFVITLTDESGQEITTLPAGEYEIQVSDPAVIHNFHFMGPGGIDESTSVPEKTETTWQVSLEEGEYTYVCDPHSESMIGQFTVTS